MIETYRILMELKNEAHLGQNTIHINKESIYMSHLGWYNSVCGSYLNSCYPYSLIHLVHSKNEHAQKKLHTR